jgi:hypothetical protein
LDIEVVSQAVISRRAINKVVIFNFLESMIFLPKLEKKRQEQRRDFHLKPRRVLGSTWGPLREESLFPTSMVRESLADSL